MKINRPNNWVEWQAFDGEVLESFGNAYTITDGEAADASNRVQELRDTVTEVTGMRLPTARKPMGFN